MCLLFSYLEPLSRISSPTPPQPTSLFLEMLTKKGKALLYAVCLRTGLKKRMYLGSNQFQYEHYDEYLDYMKNGVFWDVTPCGSCKNRRFGRI
jgi:hypothetical protein